MQDDILQWHFALKTTMMDTMYWSALTHYMVVERGVWHLVEGGRADVELETMTDRQTRLDIAAAKMLTMGCISNSLFHIGQKMELSSMIWPTLKAESTRQGRFAFRGPLAKPIGRPRLPKLSSSNDLGRVLLCVNFSSLWEI